jgi:hypothetical protein
MDTRPPETAPQCMTDLSPLSPVQGTPPQAGQPVVTGAEAPGEDGEVWPPGFEPAKHMAGTSTPTQDGHPDDHATPDPSTLTMERQPDSDAMPTPREVARRLARFTEKV